MHYNRDHPIGQRPTVWILTMGSVPSNPASLPMLAHIAGDQIMAASHALSLLPQMSRLRHGV